MKSYYLFFGITNYRNGLGERSGAITGLADLSVILEKKYGFHKLDFLSENNATSDNILKWIDRLANENLLEEDSQLLIYFSCRGYTRKSTGQQYWIAYDGEDYKSQGCMRTGWIEAEDVIGAFKHMPCRHILLISDTLLPERFHERYKGSLSYRGIEGCHNQHDYYKSSSNKISREYIAPCTDNENNALPYTHKFAKALENSPHLKLTPEDLLLALKNDAREDCLHRYGALHYGHEVGGSFVFEQTGRSVELPLRSINDEAAIPRPILNQRPCVSEWKFSIALFFFLFATTSTVMCLAPINALFSHIDKHIYIFTLWLFPIVGYVSKKRSWLDEKGLLKSGIYVSLAIAIFYWLSAFFLQIFKGVNIYPESSFFILKTVMKYGLVFAGLLICGSDIGRRRPPRTTIKKQWGVIFFDTFLWGIVWISITGFSNHFFGASGELAIDTKYAFLVGSSFLESFLLCKRKINPSSVYGSFIILIATLFAIFCMSKDDFGASLTSILAPFTMIFAYAGLGALAGRTGLRESQQEAEDA